MYTDNQTKQFFQTVYEMISLHVGHEVCLLQSYHKGNTTNSKWCNM